MLWNGFLLLVALFALYEIALFVRAEVTLSEVVHVVFLGFLTLIRVMVLIVLASIVWVPIGVWIGLRPRVAHRVQPIIQFLAAFPANLFFPIVVSAIVVLKLNPEIWLSPLMILGTQWYILFNVIGGTLALPTDYQYVAGNFGVRNWLWWRRLILPAIFPAYVTGAVTASGGSWNASIVAEIAKWGDTTLQATGIGAYIADMTAKGDFPRIALGHYGAEPLCFADQPPAVATALSSRRRAPASRLIRAGLTHGHNRNHGRHQPHLGQRHLQDLSAARIMPGGWCSTISTSR